MNKIACLTSLFLLLSLLQGCVGTILGAATDVVIETAKVPFKVGGAVIDLATDDDEDDKSDEDE